MAEVQRQTYSLSAAAIKLGMRYQRLRDQVEATGVVIDDIRAIQLPGKPTRYVVPGPALDQRLGVINQSDDMEGSQP